jgi:hypothetical protein
VGWDNKAGEADCKSKEWRNPLHLDKRLARIQHTTPSAEF